MTGIIAYGAYVPRLRLQRAAVYEAHAWYAPELKAFAKGERATANWDEDSITMAVEAARDCFGARDRGGVASVVFASTSAPFADRQNAGVVKEALNLADGVASSDVGGSRKAATGALLQALYAVAGGAGTTLCVASEKRNSRPASESELTEGDGAAAFVVGTGQPIARFLGAHSATIDFVDHFRASGEHFDYSWEGRWVRDEGYSKIATGAIKEALAKLGCAAADIAHFIAPIPARGVPEALAKAAGIAPGAVCDTLSATVGDTGSAHALLMLADVLARARPGEKILLLGFGQGADVLLFEVTDAIRDYAHPRGVKGWVARRKPESNYVKHLTLAGHLSIELGMRAEFDQKQALTALFRHRKTVLGLVGGRSVKTGAVQYPKSKIGVGTLDATIDVFEDYPLAERPARILTYTADRLGFTPDPPCYYGTVEFDGGGRMICEFTDVDPDKVEVGAPMRMMFRIKSIDDRRDFIKYFWKAVPAAEGV